MNTKRRDRHKVLITLANLVTALIGMLIGLSWFMVRIRQGKIYDTTLLIYYNSFLFGWQ